MPVAARVRHLWAGALVLACALPAQAGLFSDDATRAQVATLRTQLDETTSRLESLTQNQVGFSNQLETIKADIAKLRGQIEVLVYDLDATQKRQRDFYIDLDNRLRKIESPQPAADATDEPADKDNATAMNYYEAALVALKSSDFKSAVAGFEAYIKGATVDSPQQAGAHFFAAYCYGRLKQPAKAEALYRRLVENWPADEHAPDAMLAQAESLEAMGQRKEANTVLADLVAKYPATDAAKQAKAGLKKK